MLIDVIMGQPEGVSEEDELDYVCGVRGNLKDAYEMGASAANSQRAFVPILNPCGIF